LNIKKSAARIGSNFMISFFGSLLAFDFVTEIPTSEVVYGSVVFSLVSMGMSAGYEMRKYGESRGRN
jgi:hypothetical protein